MDGESAKIRIRIEAIEIDYEGKASFLQDELLNLVQNLVGFYAEHKAAIPVDAPLDEAKAPVPALTCRSGPFDEHHRGPFGRNVRLNLLLGCCRLTLVNRKNKFTRKEIDAEMESATTYYRKNMSSNMTSSLNTLVKETTKPSEKTFTPFRLPEFSVGGQVCLAFLISSPGFIVTFRNATSCL